MQTDHEVPAGRSARIRLRKPGHLGQRPLQQLTEARHVQTPCRAASPQEQPGAADHARHVLVTGAPRPPKKPGVNGQVAAELECLPGPAQPL